MSGRAVCGSKGTSSHERVTPILRNIFVLIAVLTAGNVLTAQTASPTDLQFHKFQPQMAPELQVGDAAGQKMLPNGMSVAAVQQMQALQAEKASRTPAQQKIDSNLLYTIRMLAGKPAAPGVSYLYTGVDLDPSNNIVADVVANVSDALLTQLATAGSASLVRQSRPAQHPGNHSSSRDRDAGCITGGDLHFAQAGLDHSGKWSVRADQPAADRGDGTRIQERAARVRRQLARAMSSTGIPTLGQGSVETEGDITHRAVDARGAFGVDGTGLSIGVLSDGVTSMALSQATGDLPPTCGTPPCFTVLAGQAGAGDEGTAMLEIIHDMAPGASLYFATADNSITSFAANIRALRTAGCNIIVDDVF